MSHKIFKIAKWGIGILITLYLAVILLFFFFQEKVLFAPTKLESNYEFNYSEEFEELSFVLDDGITLNALHFKADSSKGLVYYLHGNGGALDTWGRAAIPFTKNEYDCLILDYRGYGKSEGKIKSQKRFLKDVNSVYQDLLKLYTEDNIIVVGSSIGTCPAAYVAANNQPSKLILKAPYNNMNYMRKLYYSWLPKFGLRYPLQTDEFVSKTKTSITIFHGDNDLLIPFECSKELEKLFDGDDELIMLKGQGHGGMSVHPDYISNIKRILDL